MAFRILGVVATATAFAALCNAASAQAPALPTSISVSSPGDGQMTCPQLAMEIGRMDQITGTAQQNQANAETNGQVVGALGSAAVNGALYSGVLGSVPGLGLFASGAERAARARAESQAEQAKKLQADAQMRRVMLNGIYQGKACDRPQPVQAVAPAPGAPPATGTITYAPGDAPPAAAPAQ